MQLRDAVRPLLFYLDHANKSLIWLHVTLEQITGLGSRALSIQQKFRLEISETSRAQWNGTFRLHKPDPSHRAFCYCGFSAHS